MVASSSDDTTALESLSSTKHPIFYTFSSIIKVNPIALFHDIIIIYNADRFFLTNLFSITKNESLKTNIHKIGAMLLLSKYSRFLSKTSIDGIKSYLHQSAQVCNRSCIPAVFRGV